ncbi:MAG: hypothetical protein IBJ03_09185 [Gemmatimonadaceae bacterium]|nr:hypothetical protein [Gemmatimonadaceae bacterium]
MSRAPNSSSSSHRPDLRPLMRPLPDVGRAALRKGARLLERPSAMRRRRRRQALMRRALQVVAVLALTAAASLLTARGLDEVRHPAIRAMYGMSTH